MASRTSRGALPGKPRRGCSEGPPEHEVDFGGRRGRSRMDTVVEIQVTSIKFITEVDGPEHFKKA
jgi:hypothetical protein